MRHRLLLLLLCALPLRATELSLPLQNLMEHRSVAQLLSAENRVALTQAGNDNLASLLQQGSGNSVTLNQRGHDQSARMVQQGHNNRIRALMMGRDNELEMEQVGRDNRARLFLGGNGGKLDLQQHGDANLMDVGIFSITPMDSPLAITQTGSERTLYIGIY